MDIVEKKKKDDPNLIQPLKFPAIDLERSRERMRINKIIVKNRKKTLRQIAEEADE